MSDYEWPRERVARIFFKLLFFVGAAGLLAYVCRQGASLILVALAFVLYVVASTLWVRGQYQASVDAITSEDSRLRPWTFPYWISAPAVVVGGAIAWLGIRQDFGTALLLGVMLAFLGVGYLLMRFRMNGWRGTGKYRVTVGALLLSRALS